VSYNEKYVKTRILSWVLNEEHTLASICLSLSKHWYSPMVLDRLKAAQIMTMGKSTREPIRNFLKDYAHKK
jgi:hypothetical protein